MRAAENLGRFMVTGRSRVGVLLIRSRRRLLLRRISMSGWRGGMLRTPAAAMSDRDVFPLLIPWDASIARQLTLAFAVAQRRRSDEGISLDPDEVLPEPSVPGTHSVGELMAWAWCQGRIGAEPPGVVFDVIEGSSDEC